MAIEDIGLADPRALEQALAAMQAVHFLGIPEGDQALAQAAIYLSASPKSDAAYRALTSAVQEVRTSTAEPVPLHLRNPVTGAMREWGYGEGYRHAISSLGPDRHAVSAAQAGRHALLRTHRPRGRETHCRASGGDPQVPRPVKTTYPLRGNLQTRSIKNIAASR